MKRVAFICHTHHQKSKAFDYIYDVISESYSVDRYWDGLWCGDEPFDIEKVNEGDYDGIVFAQVYPDGNLLQKLKCKNITWLPMYDTEVTKKDSRYYPLIIDKVKIVSFSRTLLERLKNLSLDVEYLQFFPQSFKRLNEKNRKVKIFFWPRSEKISWDTVKSLIGKDFKGEIIIQNVPDPKNTFILPSNEDIKKYNITLIDRWLEYNEGLNIRNACDVFIAPREYEGIGLTFLEAMASGVAVIAPNSSTMNEYINTNNGYLYDLSNPYPIDLSNLSTIKNNSYEYIKDGYKEWLNNKHILNDTISRDFKSKSTLMDKVKGYFWKYIIPITSNIKKVIAK